MSPIFKKQERITLKTQALNEIKRAIQNGKLRAGDRIVETKLAEEMGMSKFPIREAIRYLEKEGLVVSVPFKGTYVSRFDERDVEELYTLRSALEELAIRLFMGRVNESKVEKLETILRQMQKAAKEQKLDKMVSADMQFHRTICELSEHRKLLGIWLTLENQTKSFISREGDSYERQNKLVETHHPILKAIKSGDSQLAEKSIRNHLIQALVLLKNLYKKNL
jgi:DNA-binding GntR family transcriptional regulator